MKPVTKKKTEPVWSRHGFIYLFSLKTYFSLSCQQRARAKVKLPQLWIINVNLGDQHFLITRRFKYERDTTEFPQDIPFWYLMTLNRVKLGRAVTFMKYLAGVVSLIFLRKTLISNKITFFLSNSLNLADLLVNDLKKSISKKNLSRLLSKNSHQRSLLLIMNYQPLSFVGEGSWNKLFERLKK